MDQISSFGSERTFRLRLRVLVLLTGLSLATVGPNASATWPWEKKPTGPRSAMESPPMWLTVCRNTWFMLTETFHKRPTPVDDKLNFLDDRDLLSERRQAAYLGRMASIFDPHTDTRIYYTATGKPDENGNIPIVDPEAKALFIYVHGSGTQKASGANFAYKANALASMGYAALSFDLPYHMDGPVGGGFLNGETFVDWLHGIIEKYRVPGQPVIMAGHSFGPEVIGEYLMKYPKGLDGAVMLSPAAYTDQLQLYFDNVTSHMADFWGDTQPNNTGSHWGGMVMANGTAFRRPANASDPTVVNPDLKLRILSGQTDEYFPKGYDVAGDMKRLFKNANVTIEPGVGHYIFTHKDANGHDVVMRELLATVGETLDHERDLKKVTSQRKVSETDTLAQRYTKEPFFREWMDRRGGRQTVAGLVRSGDQKAAKELFRQFRVVTEQREQALFANIRKTQTWAPEFYAKHSDAIAQLGKKSYDPTPLVTAYGKLIDELPDEQAARVAQANSRVYAVAPPPPRPTNPFPNGSGGKRKGTGQPPQSGKGGPQPAKPNTQPAPDSDVSDTAEAQAASSGG